MHYGCWYFVIHDPLICIIMTFIAIATKTTFLQCDHWYFVIRQLLVVSLWPVVAIVMNISVKLPLNLIWLVSLDNLGSTFWYKNLVGDIVFSYVTWTNYYSFKYLCQIFYTQNINTTLRHLIWDLNIIILSNPKLWSMSMKFWVELLRFLAWIH